MYAERDIERRNLALRLLDIIEEDGCCELVGEPFNFVKSRNQENLYELEDNPESYYTIPVYVNYKNAMRFCKIELSRYTDSKDGALWQSHLRVEKAWNIYHTLRLYFMRSWWSMPPPLESDLNILLASAGDYMLSADKAKGIITEVKTVMKLWRTEARRLGLLQRDIDMFAPRFDKWIE